jgi:hypothetical protein
VARRRAALERDHGPVAWLLPFLEARYTAMKPAPSAAEDEQEDAEHADARDAVLEARRAERSGATADEPEFLSHLQPGRSEEVLGSVPLTYWQDTVRQYRRRQAEARKEEGIPLAARADFVHAPVSAPGLPGTTNWVPIGPSVVRRGQPTGRPAISGRASGIAIAPGGSRVYVATADGGVWRSDDAGATWRSTMENFDIDPTAFAATSQACGAIAIDEADPDRVYVGTGEGDTNALFTRRLTSALPSYRGVGPLRSDNGGGLWTNEPTAPGSPTLVGSAFYALAVDPGDRENVVAATNIGLYRREPDGAGGHHWVQKRTGVHSSVVVARTGSTTTFLAAAWGDRVYSSSDGSTWTAVGTSFPGASSRIGLAVQRNNPNVVYALVADTSNALLGVFRLTNLGGTWKHVGGSPPDLLGSQGDYDLTIAVDPNDVNRVFMGGSAVGVNDASIYRGVVSGSGAGFSMATTFVGTGAHPDVHVLAFPPGDSNTVWCCCDGGVFRTTDARGAGTFRARNTGLATMSANYLAGHPTQPAILFCGFQDNGTGRYTGEECWTHVAPGDGGYPVISWHDPYRVLVYWNGSVNRATDGGRDYSSWEDVTPASAEWWVMAQPLVTAPYNPARPADANVVAYGAGPKLFVSTSFGDSWATLQDLPSGLIYSLVFASPTRLFVGATNGRVYRYDKSGSTWTQTRIDNAAGGALPLAALVTDIAVDPADSTRRSIYITLGGHGDFRHVWRFDGTRWSACSGPSAGALTSLLDVEHNAIVTDGTAALYVAADIGVWRSTDGGDNWTALENGLPDSAVLDLHLHRESRRLRASLHGRGVYEYKLDPPAAREVELYIRDTTLDLGLTATVDGLNDPAAWPIDQVRHWESPNIKVDVPTTAGWQTPTPRVDFYEFNDKLVDRSAHAATLNGAAGTVTNRVYVEVHNRGITTAASARVMLLLTDASAGLPPLPAGYATNVQTGAPISTAAWQTVGIKDVTNLRVGFPQVVEFDLPSTLLPPPASLPGHGHQCLVALLHASNDVFSSAQTDVDLLTVNNRKVAQRNMHVVEFVGVPPSGTGAGRWSRLLLHPGERFAPPYELELDLRHFPGTVGLVFPAKLMSDKALQKHKPGNVVAVKKWAAGEEKLLEAWLRKGRFSHAGGRQMLHDVRLVAARPMISVKGGGRKPSLVHGLSLAKGASLPVFVRVTLPPKAKVGSSWEFSVALRSRKQKRIVGGSSYHVGVVRRPKRS